MIKKDLVPMISAINTIICLFSSFIIFNLYDEWYVLLLACILFVLFIISSMVGIISSVLSIKEKTKYKALDFVLLIINIINSIFLLIFIAVFSGAI